MKNKKNYMSDLANFAYNAKARDKKRIYKKALEAATEAQLETLRKAQAKSD